jgi:hypothetical protein
MIRLMIEIHSIGMVRSFEAVRSDQMVRSHPVTCVTTFYSNGTLLIGDSLSVFGTLTS